MAKPTLSFRFIEWKFILRSQFAVSLNNTIFLAFQFLHCQWLALINKADNKDCKRLSHKVIYC